MALAAGSGLSMALPWAQLPAHGRPHGMLHGLLQLQAQVVACACKQRGLLQAVAVGRLEGRPAEPLPPMVALLVAFALLERIVAPAVAVAAAAAGSMAG